MTEQQWNFAGIEAAASAIQEMSRPFIPSLTRGSSP